MKKILCLSVIFLLLKNCNAQNVGIGITTPALAYKLQVHTAAGSDVSIGLTNGLTGPGNLRGTRLRAFDNDFAIVNQEPTGKIIMVTSNLDRLTLTPSGNIGIGISTPLARLHVSDSSVLFSAAGEAPLASSVPPVSGSGRRMMWYADKAAFRVGYALNDSWDSYNTGMYSMGMGYGTAAVGDFSTALGVFTVANNYAFASGYSALAGGYFSTAMGFELFSRSAFETTIGSYNTDYSALTNTGWNPSDRLFTIGNGNALSGTVVRSNALTILKNGNTGIGNINPEYTLDVANRMRLRGIGNASSTAGIWFNNINNSSTMGFMGVYDDNNLGFYGNGGGWGFIMNTNSGNIGIGTTTPSQKLQVIGNICATGTITSCSDIRYKTSIVPVSNALDAVMAIHPFYYHWKKEFKDKGFSNTRQIGFSAQEVEKYFPEMVLTDKDGYKSVDYSRMAPVLLEAIKEQQKMIATLQKQMAELQHR
jgi:Chaperone of endosialidase